VKILIVGLGSIGRRHLRNLVALGEHDLILCRTRQSTLPEAELAGFPCETDLAAALRHQPAAAIISNPTALHLEAAIPAAEAGCHLLLEKPVAASWDQVAELQAALQRSGSRVLVGYQFRFHPGLQRIAGWLGSADGPLGRALGVRSHWGEYLPGWHPWEDYRRGYSARADLGGGVVLTLSHPLDYLRWLLGEVDGVWALEGRQSGLAAGVEDTAEIGLRFANGALGSVHLNYYQRPPAHWLEITGTQGTVRWDSANGAVRLFQAEEAFGTAPIERRQLSSVPGLRSQEEPLIGWQEFPIPLGFERNDLFLAEMQHFLAVCRAEAEPVCSLADGLQALKLALAAHRSAQAGRFISSDELRSAGGWHKRS
jgi:predicted dehydrogenase